MKTERQQQIILFYIVSLFWSLSFALRVYCRVSVLSMVVVRQRAEMLGPCLVFVYFCVGFWLFFFFFFSVFLPSSSYYFFWVVLFYYFFASAAAIVSFTLYLPFYLSSILCASLYFFFSFIHINPQIQLAEKNTVFTKIHERNRKKTAQSTHKTEICMSYIK